MNGWIVDDDELGDLHLKIKALDDHIGVLEQKLAYLLLTEQPQNSFSWQNISNCKREIDQAVEERMRLSRLLPRAERDKRFAHYYN